MSGRRHGDAGETHGEGHRVTIADVAAAAGVSTATVSRVLRDSRGVTEENRRKVLEAASRYGYAPSPIASSLRTGSAPLVGMIVPDVSHIFYARALKGAQDVLGPAGYQVLVMSSNGDPATEAAAFRTLLAHRVAGVLLATSGGYEPADVPVVFFDQLHPEAGAGSVALANAEAAELLVEHLLGHGHTRIGFVGGPHGRTSADERREAFRAALGRAWLGAPAEYVRDSDVMWSAESGERTTLELLQLDPPPTAILAASDRLAVGAIRALRRAGRRVPDEIALACFDDPRWSDVIDPPLTAVRIAARELGARASELLLGQLAQPGPPQEVRVPVELIVRRSCGCEPAGCGR